jgi:hypothetical protein
MSIDIACGSAQRRGPSSSRKRVSVAASRRSSAAPPCRCDGWSPASSELDAAQPGADELQELVVGVGPGRGSALRPARFPGPLPEPDVRLPPHPALHEPDGQPVGRPSVQLGLDSQYPRPPRRDWATTRRCSPTTSWHSMLSAAGSLGPSPCGRLSRSRTTTGPPSHHHSISRQRACPRRAEWRWFPRSHRVGRRDRHPILPLAASPCLRCRPSAWPRHRVH